MLKNQDACYLEKTYLKGNNRKFWKFWKNFENTETFERIKNITNSKKIEYTMCIIFIIHNNIWQYIIEYIIYIE